MLGELRIRCFIMRFNQFTHLLRSGASVHSVGMYSWTPLLVACRGNATEVVDLILEKGPNINVVDRDGMTALAIASKEGFYEIALKLLACGAHTSLQDRAGDTNLIHAAKGGHRGIIEALIKRHADVDVRLERLHTKNWSYIGTVIALNCYFYFRLLVYGFMKTTYHKSRPGVALRPQLLSTYKVYKHSYQSFNKKGTMTRVLTIFSGAKTTRPACIGLLTRGTCPLYELS